MRSATQFAYIHISHQSCRLSRDGIWQGRETLKNLYLHKKKYSLLQKAFCTSKWRQSHKRSLKKNRHSKNQMAPKLPASSSRPSHQLTSKLTVKRQCMTAPLCGAEWSSMNNSQRSSKWHFVFPQYYSAYTLNKAGWAADLGGGWVPLSKLHYLFRLHGKRQKTHVQSLSLRLCCIFNKNANHPLL